MSLKKIGAVLIAVLALGAMMASSASAANFEAAKSTWHFLGFTLGPIKKHVSCEKDPGTVSTLKTTVGKNNTPLKLQATGITCPEAEIFNESEVAKLTGKLKFTGVTVVEPAGCSVAGGAVETNAVKGTVGMKKGSSTIDTIVFEPAVGEEFAAVSIEGCAIAGEYPVKGKVIGQPTSATCTEAETQTFSFDEAIQNDAGGALTFGNKAAQVEFEVSTKITPEAANFSVCTS